MTEAQCLLLRSFLCHDGPDRPIISAYLQAHCFQRDKIPQPTTFSRVCFWATMTLRSWTDPYAAAPYDTCLEFFLFQKHVLKPQEQLNDSIFAHWKQATQFFGLCLSFNPQGTEKDLFPSTACPVRTPYEAPAGCVSSMAASCRQHPSVGLVIHPAAHDSNVCSLLLGISMLTVLSSVIK